ncbi:hypothetical protein BpHYR1_027051 [Brachionus plicatilis]|uniref:Uncharacterized protein n=1 Tax=Brachionus plicatilis TaxID=10195 RepID=A0A3M7SAU5_BRAPC|nr:hypothetical protein BpHYR1_027051 [Brachionus plicatilis]
MLPKKGPQNRRFQERISKNGFPKENNKIGFPRKNLNIELPKEKPLRSLPKKGPQNRASQKYHKIGLFMKGRKKRHFKDRAFE